jgi:hypothetical protein
MQPSFSISSPSTLNTRPVCDIQLHKQSIVSKQAAMPLYAFLELGILASVPIQPFHVLLFVRDVMHHPRSFSQS